MLLILLAAIFFIPIFIEYVKTGLVPNFPTLIVCGFVVIAAILSLFTGMLLHTMRQKNLSDFEMQLMEIESRKK